MTQPSFGPPPRTVRYLPTFARDKLLATLIPGLIALTIAGFGVRHWIAYSRLLRSGAEISVPVDNQWVTSSKSNYYHVSYHIPADPSAQEFTEEVDRNTYDSLGPNSKLVVTYDPQTFSNHVLGKPTQDQLGSTTFWFLLGVTVAAIIGVASRFSVISTAEKEWKAMSDWKYAEPPVVSVKSAGDRSGTLTVTVDIEGESPNRRSFNTGSKEVHFGDRIPVFYDPENGKSGVLRVAAVRYVGMDVRSG